VIAIRDQRRAVEAAAGADTDDRGDPVAGEANDPGSGQGEEMRRGLGMDEAQDRLIAGDAGRDEDRGDDEQPGDPLSADRAQEEGNAQRERRGRIAEVVDQVASRAMLPLERKIATWARAVIPSTASERPTAFNPSRERLMLSSIRPWECPWS